MKQRGVGGLGIGIDMGIGYLPVTTPPGVALGKQSNRYMIDIVCVGGGSVLRSPYTALYKPNTTITLWPTPITGYHFAGWSGDLGGSDVPAHITMLYQDISITATFVPNAFTTVYDFTGDAQGWVFTPTNTQIFQGNCDGLWGGGKLNMTPDGHGPAGGYGGGTWYYDYPSHDEFYVMGDVGSKVVVDNLVDGGWQKLGVSVGGSLVNPISTATYTLDPVYMGKAIERLVWDEMATIPCSITKVTTSGFFGGKASSNNGKLNWETAQYMTQIPGTDGYSLGVNQIKERSYTHDRWVRYRLADSGSYGEGQIIVDVTVVSITGATGQTLGLRGTGADPITGTTVTIPCSAGDRVVLSGTIRTWNPGGSFEIWSDNSNNVGAGLTQLYVNTVSWNDGVLHNIYNAANDQSSLIPVDLFYLYTFVTLSGGSIGRDPNRVKYVAASTVDLTAVPTDPGWYFTVWSGDLSGASNPSTLTFPATTSGPSHQGTQTVTANFGRHEYTFNVTVVGTGSVSQSPTPAIYRYGDIITLTATPGAGYALTGWSGDATGTDNPKNVTVVGNTNITGTFSVNPYTTEWDFTAGAENWVFVDDTGTTGQAPGDSRLHIHNANDAWAIGRWKYSYNTMSGLKTMMYDTGAFISVSDYNLPTNSNPKIGVNILGMGEYENDLPLYVPEGQAIGYPVDQFIFYDQIYGAGNDQYIGKVVVSGFFEGEAQTGLANYMIWSLPLYVTQIPDAYGKGKMNYFRARNTDWDTYIRYQFNYVVPGITTGQLKVTVTCVESTANNYEKLKFRSTGGTHPLTTDGGFTTIHKGDTVTLSGTPGQTYYSDGTFEIWSEASDYRTGTYGDFYISKIEWVDASIGLVTLLDRPL
jgi:uncharacterized repeat protein (TIGR02543 family)